MGIGWGRRRLGEEHGTHGGVREAAAFYSAVVWSAAASQEIGPTPDI